MTRHIRSKNSYSYLYSIEHVYSSLNVQTANGDVSILNIHLNEITML